LIFPEGTVTNGHEIIKFKKGCFNALLPLKPLICDTRHPEFELGCGSIDLFPHFARTLCYLYHTVTFTELPVVNPTDYMFSNYKNKEITEKWEIYSEVVRDIYCEAGKFGKSNQHYRDGQEYYKTVMNIKSKGLINNEDHKHHHKGNLLINI
jgi:1-acyl-sn-glycerol-3-phosphate acyltransferase